MPDAIFIRCPECNTRFKSSADKEGKKIRCPECDEPFRVEEDMISRPKETRKVARSKDAAPETAIKAAAPPPPTVPPAPPKDAFDDEDEGADPYKVEEVEVKARCPNCAKEMANEKAFICLYCGYNTLTREIGKTEKTIALSTQEHLIHLAAALGNIFGAVLMIIFLLWYCILFPAQFGQSWLGFLDHESMRMWITIIALFFIYGFGSYGLHKVIFDPKPKEVEKE